MDANNIKPKSSCIAESRHFKIKKTLENTGLSRALLISFIVEKLSLGELGSATGSLEAVLKCSYVRFSLRFRAFWAFPLKVAPLFNHKMGTSDARFYCRNAAFTTLTSSSGLLYFT